ncbi:ABC transporter ATP-binding protein [Nitrospira sp. BLG_2]|uniref:ABC transporter ATP-binding protein n=1 Tax=Nitrospira sp. BLG_2 TaxID=3397507 RepID=UPI003B99A601
MGVAIAVEGLSKKYLIGHQREPYTALRDVLTNGAKRFASRLLHPFSTPEDDVTHETFWALKDVNFTIQQGDRVGIIGRNGAGKSTLLKILSRITEPTSGRMRIRGRVSSLLEVGTGFHPELTGRENIFLNGAVLGMRRAEIVRKFDEIVAFAEVEQFLDTPVKRYSSGMYIRLAFAVAAHLEPEIFIVDEVLAVGDIQFQRKCLGKMEDVGKEGRTVLFVSHNMAAVNQLCTKGLLIDKGRISAEGAVENILGQYIQSGVVNRSHTFVNRTREDSQAKARLIEARVLGKHNESCAVLPVDQPASIMLVWRLKVPVPFLRVGVEITDTNGVVVLSSMDTDTTGLHGKPRQPGIFHEMMSMPPFLLMPGVYSVKTFAGMPGIERIMEMENILEFEVTENQTHLSHVPSARRSGYIAAPLQWEINRGPAE